MRREGDHVHMNNDLYNYLQKLHTYVQTQNKKIKKMETIIQQLQNDIANLKQKPYTNVEKIEYKFDQLKVETLEGTLNIGLNPNDTESIEEFAVSQGKMKVPPVRQDNQDLIQKIQHKVHNFLDNDCTKVIENLELELGYELDDSYRQFIIDDVRKQIHNRIQYYIQQLTPEELQQPARSNQIAETTINQLKNDIKNAIITFMRNLPENMRGGKK